VAEDPQKLLASPGKRQKPFTFDDDSFPTGSPRKRQRISPQAEFATSTAAVDSCGSHAPVDLIGFWAQQGEWPREFRERSIMERALARKRSLSALGRRKRSDSASSTSASAIPSDERPRAEKSAAYRDPRYKTLLGTKGCFMDKSDVGISEESKKQCYIMLSAEQVTPTDSLFRDDLFEATCRSVEDRNESRILRDITPLVVPAAEILAIYGATELKCLVESMNEGWNNSDPLTIPRPQPDYSVGFRREAFTKEQLERLSPLIGDFLQGDQSLFMATYFMYFPFLSCEVKCGTAALEIADRQNAHSMFLAARGVAELYRLVGREKEIHRQILAFSISHDHRLVRIYGYYPVVTGEDITYYRHPIHEFSLIALDGKEKWTAYRFTKNIYAIWMPNHFKRICSVIDQIPVPDPVAPVPSDSTGLSQSLVHYNLDPDVDTASRLADENTPNTSYSQPGSAKRRKNPVKRS
jgi:hypothetical protein